MTAVIAFPIVIEDKNKVDDIGVVKVITILNVD